MREGQGRRVVVLDAVRTPIGRFRGALSVVRPDDLAAAAIRSLLERNAVVSPENIDDVAFGAANQSGEDNRNVGRMAALLAGLPVTTAGTTVNRLCGSSLDALLYGFRSIALGEADAVICGGVESMSRAPFVMKKPEEVLARNLDIADTTLGWRFINPNMPEDWTVSLGETAERVAEQYSVSRVDQDRFALASHNHAVEAMQAGSFDAEIVELELKGGSKFTADEGPRSDTSLERLASLKPVFRKDGTVTAGNSSPLNDGAAALLLVSEERAIELGQAPLAYIHGGAVAGVAPDLMGIGPVPAVQRLLGRLELTTFELDAIELNEAFAAQAIAVLRELGIGETDSRVNANGGAIALGHPLGASGARITTTLLHRLRRQGGGFGLASMCIGVGQGIALVAEVRPN